MSLSRRFVLTAAALAGAGALAAGKLAQFVTASTDTTIAHVYVFTVSATLNSSDPKANYTSEVSLLPNGDWLIKSWEDVEGLASFPDEATSCVANWLLEHKKEISVVSSDSPTNGIPDMDNLRAMLVNHPVAKACPMLLIPWNVREQSA